METLFNILKFVALAVSGVSTFVGLFRKSVFEEVKIPSLILGGPEKTERRLTLAGKWSIGLAVFGILVAIVSEGITQRISRKRSEAAQSAANRQLTNANLMLAELKLQSLRTEDTLRQMARANTVFEQIKIVIKVQVSDANEAARRLLADRKTEPATGAANDKPPGVVISMAGPGNQIPNQNRLPRSDPRKALLTFMERPPLSIELRRWSAEGYSPEANLILQRDTYEPPNSLSYNLTQGTLSTFWEFTCSRERWQSDGQIISVLDLGQARLDLRFPQRIGETNAPVGLSIGTVHLRPAHFAEITLTNLFPGSNQHGIFFQTTLPPAPELFNVTNRPRYTASGRTPSNSKTKQ